MTPEPTPPPFRDTAERYQTHFDRELHRKIGLSFAGEEWDTQVCSLTCCPLAKLTFDLISVIHHMESCVVGWIITYRKIPQS